MPYLLELRS